MYTLNVSTPLLVTSSVAALEGHLKESGRGARRERKEVQGEGAERGQMGELEGAGARHVSSGTWWWTGWRWWGVGWER